MMEAGRRGCVHIIMVWELSHLGYDNKTLLHILSFLQDYEAVLVTVGTDLLYELITRRLDCLCTHERLEERKLPC